MRDPHIATLAAQHWGRWEAAIERGDPIALGALQRLVAAVASRPSELTNREIELLQLIADGHTYRSVAEQLGIGRETVKTHVSRVCHKLGARNRIHAVYIAISQGDIH